MGLDHFFLDFLSVLGKYSIPAALVLVACLIGFPVSPVQQAFIDCGLVKKIQIPKEYGRVKTKNVPPKIKKKIRTNYGYDLYIEPPGGLGISDFEAKKEALEQALDAEIIFRKGHNNTLLMIVATGKLPDICPYEDMDTEGPCEFPLGYSRRGLLTFSLNDSTPNLLIGGVPGSGKSVCERLIMTYLGTKKAVAGLLQLHAIDLKGGVEFGMFERCSFLSSYTTNRDPLKVIEVFRYLQDEMNRRYEILKNTGVTNINDYNNGTRHKMKYIVTIIDEIANLDSKEAIAILTDLLRMGRAAGLYFVMATQRPSADVLPGNIKANIPATIAFLCRNAVNSGILLDHAGAEKLKGKGHGILQTTEEIEFQCFFLDTPQAREMIKPFIVKEKVEAIPLYDTSGSVPL